MDSGASLSFDAVPVPTPPGGPLAVELVPAPDPWAVARKLAHLPHLLFLDSAEKHADRGRYSYVMADPSVFGGGPAPPVGEELFPGERIDHAQFRLQTAPGLPPFQGGSAGLFGYGLSRGIERIDSPRFDEFRVSDTATASYGWVVSFDHAQQRAWLVANGFPHPDAESRLQYGQARIQKVLKTLRSDGINAPRSPRAELCPKPDLSLSQLCLQHPLPGFPGVTSNFSREGYEAAVRRAVEYVHAGDCFQVNLSQRLLAPLREHPLELYGRLRDAQPGPVRRVLRPRRLPDSQRVAGTLLACASRWRGRDAADQGHPPARLHAGRRRVLCPRSRRPARRTGPRT